MARIFLSYAHEDHAAAKRIVDALAREGLEAWWDHDIPPGRTWAQVIGERIDVADVVIVTWSKRSVESNFVQEEAQMALDVGKLLPVKVDDVEPPIGFRRVHASNLVGWNGEANHRQWRALLDEVRQRLDGGPVALGAPNASLASTRTRMPLGVGIAALIFVTVVATYFASKSSFDVADTVPDTIQDVGTGRQVSASARWVRRNAPAVEVSASTTGADCANAVATITFSGDGNAPLFTQSFSASSVITLALARDREAMQMSLATWVAEGAGMPKYAGDLPDWRPDDQDPMRGDLPFYLETDADRSSYAALRQSNVPVYCFVQGLESAACLVVQGGYLERIGLQVL